MPTPNNTTPFTLTTLPGIKGNKITPLKNNSQHSINNLITSIINNNSTTDEPFYVLDLGNVIALFHQWVLHLPTITPYFAVKCNPNPALLSTLTQLGANFDCASSAEITSVLSLDVAPDCIIYANACKAPSHIAHAHAQQVNLTTFDSVYELRKLATFHPNCSLLLRINPPLALGVRHSLGDKYGALPQEVRPLLLASKSMNLHVIGVAFHVGSGATIVEVYDATISEAREVFGLASEIGLGRMRVLDIGGGFIAGPEFEGTVKAINASVSKHFGDWLGLKVIAEPGRYFAETAATLACCVIGKRMRGGKREYWLSDGLYGSMNCVKMDAVDVNLVPLALRQRESSDHQEQEEEVFYESTLFGPTCDSMDVVGSGVKLPEMEVGDWMVAGGMGAYAKAMGSEFNGFSSSQMRVYLANSMSN